MFVLTHPYGSVAQWPTYVASGNSQETNEIAKEQGYLEQGLVATPNFMFSSGYLPPFYDGSVRAANGIGKIAGLGDASGAISQGVSVGAGVTSTALSTAAVQGALGISAAAAGFATLGIGAAAAAVIMFLNRKGPKQKVASTSIVNEAEPILAQNRDIFLSGPKTDEAKEYALGVFNQVWASVVASCGDQSLGNPGKACISDRQRGGKWDWFSYYYDPIANTPTVPQVSRAASDAQATIAGIVGPVLGPDWATYLGGGLVLMAIIGLMESKGKK